MNDRPVLKLYNSISRKKESFNPSDPSCVLWYNCGPTVYDASHMGHARSYITFDIIRRVMSSYFSYNISYVQNVTDIDDKIIFRARRNHLLNSYIDADYPLDQILADANAATESLEQKITVSKNIQLLTILEKIKALETKIASITDTNQLAELEGAKSKLREAERDLMKDADKQAIAKDSDKIAELEKARQKLKEDNVALTNDPDKLTMLEKLKVKARVAISSLQNAYDSKCEEEINKLKKQLYADLKDPLSEMLDRKFGSSINDQEIFAGLARHWEEDFNNDMKALNILSPDTVTRVSEYVPEVIKFVQGIIDRNYGYVSNGSVYFNTVAFQNSPCHVYGKLLPEAIGDLSALAEGEGELSIGDDRLREKKSPNDFALWKASKPGEPFWESQWGKGRPGWHIECSVMACAILGKTLDIHSGGIDLKFPHHENEIAQVEAYYDHNNWIGYFLHSGHLKIEGCKMSKSLKNFITIKDALNKYSARQLRIAFLLHSWNSTLDYSENTMSAAIQTEKLFQEFFLTVKDIIRVSSTQSFSKEKWEDSELELDKGLRSKQNAIHEALCDSIDTVTVMKELRELINQSNSYIAYRRSMKQLPSARLLTKISTYLTKMFHIFGVIEGEIERNIGFPDRTADTDIRKEEVVIPYLTVLANFRSSVRDIARERKMRDLLDICDDIRDNRLPNLGVRLEDLEDGPAIKLVDRETLLKERENKLKIEEEKRIKKEEALKKQKELEEQRNAKRKMKPREMFKLQLDKYSKFDDRGIPTHDAGSNELSAKSRKKLIKQYEAQERLHNDYVKSLGNGHRNCSDHGKGVDTPESK